MGLKSKTIIIQWAVKTRKWYIEKGYKYTKLKDEFEVKVEDLTDCSHFAVDVTCDGCGEPLKPVKWQTYKNHIHCGT